jgi:GalNAc-alpha-(1->4)-GalNAc-alpha-(1->3)-diNAcBac-PP-undecaprenol alpha-1,4-N-acetyl-D-galactosaminyltransferase
VGKRASHASALLNNQTLSIPRAFPALHQDLGQAVLTPSLDFRNASARARMRITLVISTFGSGGSERAMSVMANYWAATSHDVTLITLAPAEHDFYALHSRVKRVGLDLVKDSTNLIGVVRNNFARVTSLRREIRHARPDVVICFGDTTNVKTLFATSGTGVPVVVCEQVDPRQYPIGRIWDMLRRLVYPRAVTLVVVSSAMATCWAEGIARKDRIRVIPNPIYLSSTGSVDHMNRQNQGFTIMAMGRLVKQKGFDFLLEAFRICSDRHPKWSLDILGEGDERQSLELLRAKLRLKNRVRFLGIVKEPSTLLRQADLFVMSSRFEGFPLALIEAMACGLPVISTDCPTGPSEIIRGDIDGILVPPGDVTALAGAMDQLMGNPAERRRLAARAVEVVERFGTCKIMTMWDELLAHIVSATHV